MAEDIDMFEPLSDDEALLASLEGKEGRLERRGSPIVSTIARLTQLHRVTLSFRESKEGGFFAAPQRNFKPRGLIVWGAPPLSTIDVHEGINLQATVSCDRTPTKWFSYGQNFEQIKKALDEGIEIPSWCTWDAISPGIIVRAHVYSGDGALLGGKDGVELCMWGEAIW